jgi:hypothetical protein
LNLDTGVTVPIANEKFGKRILDDLRRCSYPQCSSLASLERTRALRQRLDISEKPSAAPEQLLTFRGQLHTSTDAIEQRYSELSLKGVKLARGSGLTEV